MEKLDALMSLASFTFWIALVSSVVGHMGHLEYVVFCKAALVGLIASIWVLGAHLLQFAKLTDYNPHTAWLIGVLITASNLIVFEKCLYHTMVVLIVACVLAYGLPILNRKFNKYIA